MKSPFTYIVAGTILLTTFIVISIYQKLIIPSFKKNNLELTLELEKVNNLIGDKDYLLSNMISDNFLTQKTNFLLEDEKGSINSFSEIVSDKPHLVLVISKINCNVCVESELEIIHEYITKKQIKNVLLISDYENKRHLYVFKRINQIHTPIYRILDTFKFESANEAAPFYFYYDGQQIKNIFIPNKTTPELTISYLKEYMRNVE